MTEFERNYHGAKQPLGYPAVPANWLTGWESLLASDGKAKLFALYHQKREPAVIQNVLIIAHGFGEYGGRYQHFPHFLNDSVDAIYIHDHRGHGRSDGLRGDAPSFDTLVDDLVLVVKHVVARYTAKNAAVKFHFLGHSMGGLIGLRLGFLHAGLPLETFQISSPYLGLFKEPPIPLRLAASVLAKTWSSLSLTADVAPDVISRDERVTENYAADRLNHSRMTPRFYTSLLAAQKDTKRRTDGLNYRLALHLPLADQLVNNVLTMKFYNGLKNEGKRIFEYPEFRHESMNELGKEKFFDNVRAVIDEVKK